MQVTLAGEGACETLLRKEFPQLSFLPLRGYRVEYGRSKLELMGKMLWQIPRLLECIDEERDWLAEVMKTEEFDVVISDNRYGLTHPDAFCVFVGHQLLIKTSLGDIVDNLLQPFQLDLINKFNACWVPDLPGIVNLAGDLSHPENMPRVPVSYVGLLSRLVKKQKPAEHLLVVISGPEPQRTIFEEIILEQAVHVREKILVARGLPGDQALPAVPPHVTMVNHLSAEELNEAMASASFVISRCGYSSVMDIARMQKKSILVPTPGQTEQEYLSGHLMQYGMALCFAQEDFDLVMALRYAGEFNYYFPPELEEDLLTEAVQQLHTVAANQERATT